MRILPGERAKSIAQVCEALGLPEVPEPEIVEAKPASLREEAELYLPLNGAGTAQTEDDMAAAARVAKS